MGEKKKWYELRRGAIIKTTPEGWEEFRDTRIFKDQDGYFDACLENFREMLEVPLSKRTELWDGTERSDEHVRGMIEFAKDCTLLLDRLTECAVQQRETEEMEHNEQNGID